MQFSTLTLAAMTALTVLAQHQNTHQGLAGLLLGRDNDGHHILQARKGNSTGSGEESGSGSGSGSKGGESGSGSGSGSGKGSGSKNSTTPTPTSGGGKGGGSKSTPTPTSRSTSPAVTAGAVSFVKESNAGGFVTIAGMAISFALFM